MPRRGVVPRDCNVDIDCPTCGEDIRVYCDYGVFVTVVIGCYNRCDQQSSFNREELERRAAIAAQEYAHRKEFGE